MPETITARVEPEDWQLEEIGEAIKELDSGQAVSHAMVSKWLRSWGKSRTVIATPKETNL